VIGINEFVVLLWICRQVQQKPRDFARLSKKFTGNLYASLFENHIHFMFKIPFSIIDI
jgi:hypothetical protein